MGRGWLRLAVALAVVVVLAAPAVPAQATPGNRAWVATYNGMLSEGDVATSVAVSPDGTRAYVTGMTDTIAHVYSAVALTIAYDSASGAELWRASIDDVYPGVDPQAAAAPDGHLVFVAVQTGAAVIKAYDAQTGAEVWSAQYDGGPKAGHGALLGSLAVSPGSDRVFFTGTGHPQWAPGNCCDYLTAGFDAATGARLWAQHYNGAGGARDVATSIAVSPSGRAVYITGYCDQNYPMWSKNEDMVTFAYRASDGKTLWMRQYSEAGHGSYQEGHDLVVGPGGGHLYVVGDTIARHSIGADFVVLAYSAGTGRELWVQHYSGGDDWSCCIVADQARVYVSGQGEGPYGYQQEVVAFDARTGAQLWTHTKNHVVGWCDHGRGLYPNGCMSEWTAGSVIYVVGTWGYPPDLWRSDTQDIVVDAYDGATGKVLWSDSFDPSVGQDDYAFDVAVSPDGDRLFVVGYSELSQDPSHDYYEPDWITIAYDTT